MDLGLAASMDPSSKYGNSETHYQTTTVSQNYSQNYKAYENASARDSYSPALDVE
jgi:hypothetical protein